MPKPHSFISLFCNTGIGCSYYWGFVADGGNETIYLLLNLPPSLLALFLSHFYQGFFIPLAPLFAVSPPLSLWFSSPPRCEQVIGWSRPYNPFVVGRMYFSQYKTWICILKHSANFTKMCRTRIFHSTTNLHVLYLDLPQFLTVIK